jgi:hypothetical protein
LIKGLCKENNIPLKSIKSGCLLGEWLGLCKYDSSNNVRKTRKCSSVALKDFPSDITEEESKHFLTSF